MALPDEFPPVIVPIEVRDNVQKVKAVYDYFRRSYPPEVALKLTEYAVLRTAPPPTITYELRGCP